MKPFPWLSIVSGCFLGELLFILYFQNMTPNAVINDWYKDFQIYAVALDLLIIMIGYGVMNMIVRRFHHLRWWHYIIILLVLQIIHDICFYMFIIRPLHNKNLSPFWSFWQRYARTNGYLAILADSCMFIVITGLIFALKEIPRDVQIFILLSSIYWIIYRLFPIRIGKTRII